MYSYCCSSMRKKQMFVVEISESDHKSNKKNVDTQWEAPFAVKKLSDE